MRNRRQPLGTKALRWCAWGLLTVMISGCDEPVLELEPVKGKLLDGQGNPVFPGSVWFIADAETSSMEPRPLDASSMLQSDGSFTIRTYPHGNGARVGRYRVTLSLGAGSSPKLAKYGSPRTSTILVDVPKGGLPDLVIRLDADSPAGAARAGRPGAKGRR